MTHSVSNPFDNLVAPGSQEVTIVLIGTARRSPDLLGWVTLLCMWMVRGREAQHTGKQFFSDGLSIRGFKCRLEEIGNSEAHCPPLTNLAEATEDGRDHLNFPRRDS